MTPSLRTAIEEIRARLDANSRYDNEFQIENVKFKLVGQTAALLMTLKDRNQDLRRLCDALEVLWSANEEILERFRDGCGSDYCTSPQCGCFYGPIEARAKVEAIFGEENSNGA